MKSKDTATLSARLVKFPPPLDYGLGGGGGGLSYSLCILGTAFLYGEGLEWVPNVANVAISAYRGCSV